MIIMCPPLIRGGKEIELLGGITVFKVDYQSFYDKYQISICLQYFRCICFLNL